MDELHFKIKRLPNRLNIIFKCIYIYSIIIDCISLRRSKSTLMKILSVSRNSIKILSETIFRITLIYSV